MSTLLAYPENRKGQRSSPGPKSRAKVVTFSHKCRAHIILVLFNLMGPAQAGHLGDVRVDPLPASGSRAFQAKQAGEKSTTSGSNKGPKRAFLRAQTRARTSPLGGTWYRGRFRGHLNTANQNKEINVGKPDQRSAPRLRIATWNCGSRGNKYQEVLHWLKDEHRQGRPVDIIAILETGWKMDMKYKTVQDDKHDPQWFVINREVGKF